MTKPALKERHSASPEMVDWLKAECLRLHKLVMDGRDAANKLGAVVSMLNAEGIPIPETDPPIIIKK